MFLPFIIVNIVSLAIIFLLKNFSRAEYGRKKDYLRSQVLVGIIFGVLAGLSTFFSVYAGDDVISTRNGIVLSTGIIFGAPAGIVAGLIGAVWRFFAIFSGLDTQLASSLTTVIAGCFGAALRVWLFERKTPKSLHGFFAGVNIEILHILFIILISIKDIHSVFIGMKAFTIPLLAINGIFSALAAAVATWKTPSTRKNTITDATPKKTKLKSIAESFEQWLAVYLLVALTLSAAFIWALQTRISQSDTVNLLRLNLYDVQHIVTTLQQFDVKAQGYHVALDLIGNKHIGKGGGIILADSQGLIIGDRMGSEGKTLASKNIHFKNIQDNTLFTATIHGKSQYCMYLKVHDLYVLAFIPSDDAEFSRNVSVYLYIFLQSLVLSVMLVLIYILVKRLVIDNIHKVNRSLAKISDGNLNTLVDLHTNEEFSLLSGDINATVAALKHHTEAEKARLGAELELAKTIQVSALPSIFPPYPQHDEFEIFACMHTAREVGGDFYDFYFTDTGHLAFVVADVSGKGIPAAIFMMKAKTLLKNFAEAGQSVENVFSNTNKHLCENNEAIMFVTAWLGVLDVQSGLLRFVNAGHNPPLLKRTDGTVKYLKTKPNFVLALSDDAKYDVHELQLECGDEIFLYTDGITEAANESGELYSEERLKNAFDNKRLSVEDMCFQVLNSVNSFVGEAAQEDDITMLYLQFGKNMTEKS